MISARLFHGVDLLKLKELLVSDQQLAFFFFPYQLFPVFVLKFFNENWHGKIKNSAVKKSKFLQLGPFPFSLVPGRKKMSLGGLAIFTSNEMSDLIFHIDIYVFVKVSLSREHVDQVQKNYMFNICLSVLCLSF